MLQSFLAITSLIGLALAIYAWLFEGTGVTGTPGALLAVIGAGCTFLATAVMTVFAMRSGAKWAVAVLGGLAAFLTAVAAWFLMQNPLAAVMALTCAGILAVAWHKPLTRRSDVQ